jgi:hypothetical protein
LYNWSVSCTDLAGNAGTGQVWNVTIDTTSPAVTLSSPANLSILNNPSVNFTFTPEDPFFSKTNCSLYLDGALNKTNSSSNSNVITILPVAGIPDGIHTWYVACTDNVNTTNTSQVWTVTVDTTPPIVSLSSPADFSSFYTSAVTFAFTSVDALSPTTDCSLYLDGILSQIDDNVPNNTPADFAVTGIQPGQHTWGVNCTDDANNTGSSGLYELSILAPPAAQHSGCTQDSDCPGSDTCNGGTCTQLSCSACNVAQNHQCTAYACCSDSDCGQNESCTNHTCTAPPVAPLVTPVVSPATAPSTSPSVPSSGIVSGLPPVPLNGQCNASYQCVAYQFCDNSVCSNVTGICGYAANHSWMPYACGPEPGCPLCSGGDVCLDHQCTPPASINVSGTAFVGQNVTVLVSYPGRPCASCMLTLISPLGTVDNVTTDADGRFTLTLNDQGKYTLSLVSDPASSASVVVLLRPAQSQAQILLNLVVSATSEYGPSLLVIIVLVAAFVLYMRRGGKPVVPAGEENENPQEDSNPD